MSYEQVFQAFIFHFGEKGTYVDNFPKKTLKSDRPCGCCAPYVEGRPCPNDKIHSSNIGLTIQNDRTDYTVMVQHSFGDMGFFISVHLIKGWSELGHIKITNYPNYLTVLNKLQTLESSFPINTVTGEELYTHAKTMGLDIDFDDVVEWGFSQIYCQFCN